jgi:hypothetical protein
MKNQNTTKSVYTRYQMPDGKNKNWHCETFCLHLQLFKEGNVFLDSIVTHNNKWVHHFTLQCEQAGQQCKHSTSATTKKFKVCHSPGKVKSICTMGCRKLVLVEFMPQHTKTNAKSYCDKLQWLHTTICKRRHLSLCCEMWFPQWFQRNSWTHFTCSHSCSFHILSKQLLTKHPVIVHYVVCATGKNHPSDDCWLLECDALQPDTSASAFQRLMSTVFLIKDVR